MIAGERLSLVIPCHNEEEGLQKILPQKPAGVDEIIIVNNNSTDSTAQIARQHGATVIQELKPGYGAAYQTGLRAVQSGIIVTLDGDGQYPVADIPRLVTIFLERELDFLSCNRFPLPAGAMPLLRQLGNYLLTNATRLLFGISIQDTQSGMWIFRREVLEKINPTESGMAFSEEIKIKAVRVGLRFGEERITYLPREGISKLAPWQDGFKNLWYLIRLRLKKAS